MGCDIAGTSFCDGGGILFNEIIRLIYGCYCKMVLLSSIVTNCIGIVLAFIVLKLLPFWNANFAQEVATQFDDTFKFKVFWQNKMILWVGWRLPVECPAGNHCDRLCRRDHHDCV
ncbi:MAG: hypothetical protein ACLR71_08175 [[Clostridium] scindens]